MDVVLFASPFGGKRSTEQKGNVMLKDFTKYMLGLGRNALIGFVVAFVVLALCGNASAEMTDAAKAALAARGVQTETPTVTTTSAPKAETQTTPRTVVAKTTETPAWELGGISDSAAGVGDKGYTGGPADGYRASVPVVSGRNTQDWALNQRDIADGVEAQERAVLTRFGTDYTVAVSAVELQRLRAAANAESTLLRNQAAQSNINLLVGLADGVMDIRDIVTRKQRDKDIVREGTSRTYTALGEVHERVREFVGN